jgi:hypothetical protein
VTTADPESAAGTPGTGSTTAEPVSAEPVSVEPVCEGDDVCDVFDPFDEHAARSNTNANRFMRGT